MNPAALWLLPFALQGLAMGVDEFALHRRRAVPRWEWLGHLLDTLVFLGCLAIPLALRPAPANLRVYGALAAGSCLLVTKDEWIHRRLCSGTEHWLHAVLFILHPVVLAATGCLWLGAGGAALGAVPLPAPGPARAMLVLQAMLAAGFLALQAVLGAGRRQPAPQVDNTVYDRRGERWYHAADDPVALLRAESRLRTGWMLDELASFFGGRPLAVLDVACGGGFLANPLAAAGHRVTGIDLSRASLEVARRHDGTGSAGWLVQDARRLGFRDASFDVVCMMDFLEHVEDREAVIAEAARVLRPGGLFYFHTFNRTLLSWLLAVKGVEWAVKNTPRHMHVYRLFLKPGELRDLCARHGLGVEELRGMRPLLATWAFLLLLVTARVGPGFRFEFTRSLRVGYCGRARRTGAPRSG